MKTKYMYLVYAKIIDYGIDPQIIAVCSKPEIAVSFLNEYECLLDDYGVDGEVQIKKIPINTRLKHNI